MHADPNYNTSPEAGHDCPEFLKPSRSWEELRRDLAIRDIAGEVADVFGADELNVTTIILQLLASAYGGGIRLKLAHADLTPGFNVMVATKGHGTPHWFAALTKHFCIDLQQSVLRVAQGVEQGDGMFTAPPSNESTGELNAPRPDYKDEIRCLYFTGELPPDCSALVVPSVEAKTIANCLNDSIDGNIVLTTPARGVIETLTEMKSQDRNKVTSWVQESWLAGMLTSVDGALPGTIHALWTVPESKFDKVMAFPEWRRLPILLMQDDRDEKEKRSFVSGEQSALKTLSRMLEIAFCGRLRGLRRPTTIKLHNATIMTPVEEFHGELLEWEQSPENQNGLNFGWLADLSLKLAMIYFILEEQSKSVMGKAIKLGVEIAKRLGQRHWEIMSTYRAEDDIPATAAFTDMERKVFLKICERGPISRKDLRRTFHRMPAQERDRILTRLIEGRLIVVEKNLCCVAPRSAVERNLQ